MKNSLVVVSAMISLMLFMSCTKEQTCTVTEKDGVKTYRNKNIPTVEKLDFNPVKQFTINNNSEDENYLSYFDLDLISTDSKKNIFIADLGNNPKVNKYDEDGKFLNTFVKLGAGPGEVAKISFLCVNNDTVYVGDWINSSVSIFDNTGSFIEKIQPEAALFQVNPVGKDKFICLMYTGEIVEGKQMFKMKWAILNKSLIPIKVLHEALIDPESSSIPDEWSYITCSKDNIFLGMNNKQNYVINVYDFKGDLIEVVRKDYAEIKFTEEEIEKIVKYLKKTGERPLDRKLINKKRAVLGVYVDKNNNLIVHPAVDVTKGNTDGMLLDFFKNNIYQNSTKLKTDLPYYQCEFSTFLKFFDNRMFLVDTQRNVLEVYEY